ncbi:shikimate kinase [Gracilibacillus sp. YIM 98692]|uniref:shikimate kinase n=1 Tax=Gracilibacillus sp. YIM 98692 TaxID=2663532 RepID=UPI0013D036DF|nr:shikimate kinase [Gracilibacillus sp. YIM 98692]
MKSIYLVGFMGSGKTSIASALKESLHMEVQDTDDLVEKTYKQTIPEIFAKKGEKTFREYETEVLKSTNKTNAIIATGGGIIEKEENRKWLEQHGTVIFLQTSWEEIKRRLINDGSRPIWNNQDRDKKELLIQRTPKYLEVADVTIDTDGKTVEQLKNEIIGYL